jgi:hypothetical protein
MKCSICRGVAVFMKHDVTATRLMRKTALIECEQPKCPELVTRETMHEHLESKCSFNWKPALSQAATSGTYPSRGPFLYLSPPVFHHICISGGGPDVLSDGLLWVRVFATRQMVMVKHKPALCDRYRQGEGPAP